MLDCVIPLGNGSRWQNNELRYSLRGLTGINQVWLIGECPEWFTGGHIPAQDTFVATYNIWHKLLLACHDDRISDPFLYANDDYFYTGPVSLENYYGQLSGTSSYKEIVRHTFRQLRANGFGTLMFDVHRPMVIHKAKFIECFEFFDFYIRIGLGIVVKSTYGNYWNLPGTECRDIKLAYWNGQPEGDIFSIGDGCVDVMFRAWCEEKYPVKSRWEK